MNAIKMIELMEHSISNGSRPLAWNVRNKTLKLLKC